eukprot:31496-Pelagococcus_subviridis.AAC.7
MNYGTRLTNCACSTPMGSNRQKGTSARTNAAITRSFTPFPVYGGLSITAARDFTNARSLTRLKKSSFVCTTRRNPASRMRIPAVPS